MDVEIFLNIGDDKMKGLEYCNKIITTMKTLRQDMPPELEIHCRNTINRMCELAESLEVGWRAWVTNDFNISLQKHPLLQKMVCCEQTDMGFRSNRYD